MLYIRIIAILFLFLTNLRTDATLGKSDKKKNNKNIKVFCKIYCAQVFPVFAIYLLLGRTICKKRIRKATCFKEFQSFGCYKRAQFIQ